MQEHESGGRSNLEKSQEIVSLLPESLAQPRKLARRLDTQLGVWSEMALTNNFPAMANTRLANLIIRNCTPKPETPEDIIAHNRFKNQWRVDEANRQLNTEKRLKSVALLAQEDSLDLLTIEDPQFRYWFEEAEAHTENYTASVAYPLAVQYVKRLFIAREHLPRKTHLPKKAGIETYEFGVVLRRLIEEL